MGDDVSQDSTSTTDEYYVVNSAPKLKIPGNGNPKEVVEKMSDILNEEILDRAEKQMTSKENPFDKKEDSNESEMKSEGSPSHSHQREFHFPNLTYLGTAGISSPKDSEEIERSMLELDIQNKSALKIILSIPDSAQGSVKLLDVANKTDIASFALAHIAFCLRGSPPKFESSCFAFTYSHSAPGARHHGDLLYQCHAFRCGNEEELSRIMSRLVRAFYSTPESAAKIPAVLRHLDDSIVTELRFTIDIKEEDGKGNYYPVPKEKENVFKLRKNLEKKVFITVQQTSERIRVKIDRCLGLFVGTGRFLDNSDTTLLEIDSVSGSKSSVFTVSGSWNPTEPDFAILNTETSAGNRVFMTIGVHLLFENIELPETFKLTCKAKIYAEDERFWVFNKKPIVEDCRLTLEEIADEAGNIQAGRYSVKKIEYVSSVNKIGFANSMIESATTPTDSEPPEDDDDDEPIMSGSGQVSKEITDDQLMEEWSKTLKAWHADLSNQPKNVVSLARKGIPEALRGEVWRLLARCPENEIELYDAYRILITKESKYDQVIRRDMHRTFTANEYFTSSDGSGQESLYRVSKACSIYDDEIGYCQGLSFLAAALLLHMPEEQAFCLLVKIMWRYNVRMLFAHNFEGLYLCLYQLERLLMDTLGDLYAHFSELNLETHMYASQWFLTLFTAKFPLHAVFHILDMFLSEGLEVIFKVSLALLKTSRKDLLCLDFEGVLKYFRVNLPKRYRCPEACKELLNTAAKMKVGARKLRKYAKEWQQLRIQQADTEDPQAVLENELRVVKEEYNRLERENDALAEELVTSKIAMQNTIDQLEDKYETINRELFETRKKLHDASEDRERFELEIKQVKELFRQEMTNRDERIASQDKIIAEYKRITSDLSKRADELENNANQELSQLRALVRSCEPCSEKVKVISPQDMTCGDDTPLIVDPEELKALKKQVHELELELANTKLALVESRCEGQAMSHEINQINQQTLANQQASSRTWFTKTFTTIREKTLQRANTSAQSPAVTSIGPVSSQSSHTLSSWQMGDPIGGAVSPSSENSFVVSSQADACPASSMEGHN